MPRGRHLIMDGYNIIKCDPALRRAESIDFAQAREQLISLVASSPQLRYDEITIVFDGNLSGHPRGGSESRHAGRLRIVFSRLGETADEVIARMAAQPGKLPHVVLTDDRALRNESLSAGAEVRKLAYRAEAMPKRRYTIAKQLQQNQKDQEEPESQRPKDKKGPAHRQKKRDRSSPDLRW